MSQILIQRSILYSFNLENMQCLYFWFGLYTGSELGPEWMCIIWHRHSLSPRRIAMISSGASWRDGKAFLWSLYGMLTVCAELSLPQPLISLLEDPTEVTSTEPAKLVSLFRCIKCFCLLVQLYAITDFSVQVYIINKLNFYWRAQTIWSQIFCTWVSVCGISSLHHHPSPVNPWVMLSTAVLLFIMISTSIHLSFMLHDFLLIVEEYTTVYVQHACRLIL